MKFMLISFIIVCLPMISLAADGAFETPFLHIDPDTLTPSQNHSLLASAKANKLESIRAKSAVARITFYDQSEYDVLYYKIYIAIDIENEYVDSATVLINAKSMINGLDTLELDFNDSLPFGEYYPEWLALVVDSVYGENGRLNFEHHNNKLIVDLGHPYNMNEQFEFKVRYHGAPYAPYGYASSAGRMNGDGLAFGKQRSMLGGNGEIPVAYTSCEPYDSRRWWPCKDRPDDKADSVDIIVTVPSPYYCASNGNLKRIDIGQGSPAPQTFNYRVDYPIATYLVSLAISEYTVWSDWYYYGANDSMEIINHVYPEMYEETLVPLQVTPNAIAVLSDLYCQYPFIDEKYGHAFWEVTGAMEHQTCTSTMPSAWGTSVPLIVHELAHQWWGDMITCETWHDIWLNEGFASYSEALYYEAMYGSESYHAYMLSMEYYDDRSVYVYDTTWADDVFDIVVYDKGAWVLHMLRYYVGDEAFFDFLHEYAGSQYKHSSLTTEEFIEFCENSTGRELNRFFEDWVYGIMYPVYTRTYYVEPDLSDGLYWVCYYLLQTQTYGPDVFEMPVDFRFFSGDEVIFDTTIFNDSRQQAFTFKVPAVPDSIVVDPDNWILNKGFEMPWSYHLLQLPLDAANQYTGYLDTILCRGGSGNNEFQIVEGNLPLGLALDAQSGIISGAPGEFGDFSFTVRADDTYSSYHDEVEYSLTVMEGIGWPGDANKDDNVNILDIVFLINFKYKDGPPPAISRLADPNVDCAIDILDIVYLINYRYKNGPDPDLGCAVL